MSEFEKWWQSDENLWVHTKLTKLIAKKAYEKAKHDERERCAKLMENIAYLFNEQVKEWKEQSSENQVAGELMYQTYLQIAKTIRENL